MNGRVTQLFQFPMAPYLRQLIQQQGPGKLTTKEGAVPLALKCK